MDESSDTARLIWVEAALAVAAYDNLSVASEELADKVHATTLRRRVELLEAWLKRSLFSWDRRLGDESDEDQITVSNRSEFIPIAWQISQLIDAGGLREIIGKVRVHPDGRVFIERAQERTKEALEIGRLMVASRAIKPIGYSDPPKVVAKDIDMDALLAGPAEATHPERRE